MRLIDADKLKKDSLRRETLYDEGGWSARYGLVLEEDIDKAPTVDAEPVVHANWKELDGGLCYGCSNCGFVTDFRLSKYCPHCGAKMEKL